MRMDAVLNGSATRNKNFITIAVIGKGGSVHCRSSHWYMKIGQLCELSTVC
jgi:hypothetical protein